MPSLIIVGRDRRRQSISHDDLLLASVQQTASRDQGMIRAKNVLMLSARVHAERVDQQVFAIADVLKPAILAEHILGWFSDSKQSDDLTLYRNENGAINGIE